MAKFRLQKNSLVGGEISPTAFGRTDLPQYAHACMTMQNVIPLVSGGAYRRPGTQRIDSNPVSTHYPPALYSFVFSQTEAYCIEFQKLIAGTKGIRAWRPSTISNTQTASSASVTGAHPYSQDEYHFLQTAQSGDMMWFVHPNYKPYILQRRSASTFDFITFDSGLTGIALRDAYPYRAENTSGITLAFSAVSGTGITVTASSALFNAQHVGALFKVDSAGTIGCIKITAVTNSTHATADVVVALGSVGAVATWWESAWSDYRGWPRTVGFFQQRLAFGGNASDPDSVWFSKTASYFTMSAPYVLDYSGAVPVSTGTVIADPRSSPTGSSPFTVQMSSQKLNVIQWMSPEETLVLGTLGAECVIDVEPGKAGGFGADNCAVYNKTQFGSAYRQAVRAGSELIFALPSNDEIRSLVFSESEQSFQAEPLQVFYDQKPQIDIFNSIRYKRFEWDESRKTLWCVDTAGNFFGMTRDRKLGVTSWHSHKLGGYNKATIDLPTQQYTIHSGAVLSFTVVPNPILGINDVWLVVSRKVNGSFRYFLERFIGKNTPTETAYGIYMGYSGSYYTDCSVLNVNDYPEEENYTFSGFTDLEGESLAGTANGTQGLFTLTPSTVSGGNVVMQAPYPPGFTTSGYVVVYGYAFDSVVIPVRPEAGSVIGTSQGAIKRIHRATLRLYRTMSCKVGRDANNLETINFREPSTPLNKSAEMFTGDKSVLLDSDYDRDGFIYILQDQPLPFTLISVIAEGQTYD